MRNAFTNKAWRAACMFVLVVLVLAPATAMADFELQLLHASDQEGNVDSIDNAPNFAAMFDYFDDTYANTLILTSGDVWIPGTFLNAGADSSVQDTLREVLGNDDARVGNARTDLAIQNIIGFQASAFGNHEFDKGTSFIADTIGTDIRDSDSDDVLDQPRWMGADFPYLSANLDFSGDGELSGLVADGLLANTAFKGDLSDLEAASEAPKIAPYTLIDVNGETIGVVGATTPMLEAISSPGDTTVKDPGAGTNVMTDLAEILQPYIDAVIAAGANKVVLLAHMQQIALEEELIGYLNGVDIVIAGGSDTILADDEDVERGLRSGDTPYKTYPIVTENADGDTALVVNTDGQYLYVGRLVVTFDDDGKIIPTSIDENVSGAFATTDEQVEALWGDATSAFVDGTKGAKVKQLCDAVRDVVVTKDSETWGWTDVFLNGERSSVRTEQTNLGVLSSWANLSEARKINGSVALSLKNGGGIRASIGEIMATGTDSYEEVPPQANELSGKQTGQISTLDIENSLAFNNSLSMLTITASGILQVLEHGVAATEGGATPGQFPQIAGVAFSYDPSLEAYSRVRSVALLTDGGAVKEKLVQDGELLVDANKEYLMVTLGFLATGGDSYPFDTLASNVTDMDVAEQAALQNYLAENYGSKDLAYATADKEVANDEFIQNLSVRSKDTVLELGEDDGDDGGCVLAPNAGFSGSWLLLLTLPLLFVVRRRMR